MINRISNYNNQPSFGTLRITDNCLPDEIEIITKALKGLSEQRFADNEIHFDVRKLPPCHEFEYKLYEGVYSVALYPLGRTAKGNPTGPSINYRFLTNHTDTLNRLESFWKDICTQLKFQIKNSDKSSKESILEYRKRLYSGDGFIDGKHDDRVSLEKY